MAAGCPVAAAARSPSYISSGKIRFTRIWLAAGDGGGFAHWWLRLVRDPRWLWGSARPPGRARPGVGRGCEFELRRPRRGWRSLGVE